MVGAVLLAAALGIWLLLRDGKGRVSFPPPEPIASPSPVSLDDFVGAEACRDCHAAQYAAWAASPHGRAGGPPSPGNVIAPFDGRPIRFRDAVVIPSVTDGGQYVFTVRQEGRDPVVLRVDGVVGGGHMVGGGTQGFVSRRPDGTVRFLPFDFIRREGVWFCNTNTRLDAGWVPITPAVSLADCGDWPPTRILGTEPRYATCQQCHGSQILVAYDPEERRYDTRMASLTVNCESCHGPAREHVARARAGSIEDSADIGLRSLATLPTDASLEVCLQCHALKDALRFDYLPGDSFADHYSVKLPLVADRPFFPDGRVRTFAYQETHLFSDCYLSGSMTCGDCHEPHGQGYRDIYGRPLEGRFADGQCLGCHASKGRDVSAHTFHPPESPGSRCVACHMPYLQQPEVGTRLRYARSDHVIPVPRPRFDAALGVEVACASCHGDLSVDDMARRADQWWGRLKPHPPLVAGLAARSAGASLDTVLHPDAAHPMGQMMALNEVLGTVARPDAGLDAGAHDAVRQLAGHADLDVRAAALATLHLAAGERPDVRRFLADRLARLGADEMAVRRRWAAVLGFRGDTYRSRGDPGSAVLAYRKGLEILPVHPGLLLSLGRAQATAGDRAGAFETYRQALAVHPDRALVLVNIGVLLDELGRSAEAVDAYRRATAFNPHDATAHLNLGNHHLRAERYAEAIREYRRAVEADPGLGRAYYYLGRAYILTSKLDSALLAARNAVAFEPGNAGAREMLRDLEAVLRR